MSYGRYNNAPKAEPTLLWHDYETTGTNKALDRPTQFAAVRTDLDLNVIGDEIMLYCQPSAENLMHPMAAMVTGISPQECREKGLIEADFCRAVIQQLGKGGTCGTGYNTIAFDDEISRNMFYRNFRDPYEREWKGGNSRWDLITAVRLFAALRPDGIVWPTKDDGRPSQRLEDLAKANGLKQERAHDALSDVYATIQLAQLLKRTNPNLWNYAFELRDKKKVAQIMDVINPRPFIHVAPYYGEHGGTAVMLPVAAQPGNNNGVIAVNLGGDLAPLLDLDPATIAARLFGAGVAVDEVTGEEKSLRLPLTALQINKSPPVAPLNTLRPEDKARLGYTVEDDARIQANMAFVKDHPELGVKLAEAFAISGQRFGAPADAELAIYSGFASQADKVVMERVKKATPEQLADGGFVFEAPKFNDLLFRYRARNWPAALSAEEQATWQAYCQERLTTQTVTTTITLEAFRQTVAELQADPSKAAKAAVLEDLLAWADEVEAGFPGATPSATPARLRPRGP